MSPLPSRLRSFSLRTLLVVVTVLCTLCSWVGCQRKIVVDRRTTTKTLGDEIIVRDVNSLRSQNWAPNSRNETPAMLASVPWIRRALGDAAIQQILVPLEWSDAQVKELALQFPEAKVTRYGGLGAAARDVYHDYLRPLRPRGSSVQTTTPAL